MGAYERLEQYISSRLNTPIHYSVEIEAAGVFVCIARTYKNDYGETSEDYWGNYFDTPEEGLEACLDMLERLEFNRSFKRLQNFS